MAQQAARKGAFVPATAAKKRLKLSCGEDLKLVFAVPAGSSVKQAAQAAEDVLKRNGALGKRRVRTFKMLDDDIELDDAEESIEALVQDEMLAPVFFSEQPHGDARGGTGSEHAVKKSSAGAASAGAASAGAASAGAASAGAASAGAASAGAGGMQDNALFEVKYALASTEHVKSVCVSNFSAARTAIALEEGAVSSSAGLREDNLEVGLFSLAGTELRAEEDAGTDFKAFLAGSAAGGTLCKDVISLFVVVGNIKMGAKNARQPLGLDDAWQPSVEQTSKAMAAFLATLHVVGTHAKKKVPVSSSLPLSFVPPVHRVLTSASIVLGTELARHVGKLYAVPASDCSLDCPLQRGENFACSEASHLQFSLLLSLSHSSGSPSSKRGFGFHA
jgi:hypothetical protein